MQYVVDIYAIYRNGRGDEKSSFSRSHDFGTDAANAQLAAETFNKEHFSPDSLQCGKAVIRKIPQLVDAGSPDQVQAMRELIAAVKKLEELGYSFEAHRDESFGLYGDHVSATFYGGFDSKFHEKLSEETGVTP